jgi:long-subunit fatty acid transport protein
MWIMERNGWTLGAAAKVAALLAALAGAAGTAYAQDQVSGELVSLGKKTGIGARAMSLGEAFTAVADDYSALYYNAAGMTQLTKSEIGVNVGYGMAQNISSFQGGQGTERSLEATRLNAFNMVLTDGGHWALGAGYYVPVSFDDPLNYTARGRDYVYDAQGQMDHYRLGLAYKVSEQASLGIAASAIAGKEQLEIQDVVTARYLEEYTGFNLEPSFLFHLSDMFSVGGSAVIAERLELTDTYQERGGQPVESLYDIHHPFQTRLGLSFQSGLTQISADWHGDFWSSYTYSSAGAAFEAHDVHYPNKHSFSIGLEQYLSERGPALRAGYTWENHDDRMPQPEDTEPFRLSAGMGFIPARNVVMDLAYQYGGSSALQNSTPGGPRDLNIKQVNQQVMASLRYRW